MECAYCRETIDGAKLCRFCGKAQPLSTKARRARATARMKTVAWGLPLVLLGLFMIGGVVAGAKNSAQEAKMRRAAACAGMTYDELEAVALAAAKQGNMSEWQAEDIAAAYACPPMRN